MLQDFNIDCSYTSDFSTVEHSYEEPQIDLFYSNFFNLPDNTTIRGFFQNIEYFDRYQKELSKELIPTSNIYSKAQTIIQEYKLKHPDTELVSVHIRRGDNVNVNVEFGIKMFGQGTVLDINSVWGQYFNNAKKVFDGRKVKYLIFTGGGRDNDDSEDLKWVQTNYGTDEYVIASTSDVLIDYSLISLCDHNILSHATSFGWWAAYTNNNPNKKMIIPKDYFLDGNNSSRLINNSFTVI